MSLVDLRLHEHWLALNRSLRPFIPHPKAASDKWGCRWPLSILGNCNVMTTSFLETFQMIQNYWMKRLVFVHFDCILVWRWKNIMCQAFKINNLGGFFSIKKLNVYARPQLMDLHFESKKWASVGCDKFKASERVKHKSWRTRSELQYNILS